MSITTELQHPLLACASVIAGALDEVASVQPVYMTTAEKERALLELERVDRRIAERRMRVLAAADDVAEKHGARDVAAWFAHATRNDYPVVRAQVELAKALEDRWTKVQAGLAGGEVSVPQAHVIRHALEDLLSDVDPDVISSAEGLLVSYAADYRPAELRRLGRKILETVAPEVADAEEAKRLHREEQRAREKAYLRFRKLSVTAPPASTASCPTRSRTGSGPTSTPTPHPARLTEHCLVRRTRSPPTARTPMPSPPCWSTSTPRSCPSTVAMPPPSWSRCPTTSSSVTAIRLRDKRCRGEGCTIPATWTETHHLTPWAEGGRTDLADGISLCHHHHHRIHDHHYTHERLPTGDIRFHRRT